MTQILQQLHDAQDRYATAAGIEPSILGHDGFSYISADPRDQLLKSLWYMLDASDMILVRLGDSPATRASMIDSASLEGDILRIGDITIDLATSTVERMNDAINTTSFLVDGKPLRFTYDAWHVDGTISIGGAFAQMAEGVTRGISSGVRIVIDGVETIVGPELISIATDELDEKECRFGDVFTYAADGPLLDETSDGGVEGLDFEGRVIRVEPIPVAAETTLRMAA